MEKIFHIIDGKIVQVIEETKINKE